MSRFNQPGIVFLVFCIAIIVLGSGCKDKKVYIPVATLPGGFGPNLPPTIDPITNQTAVTGLVFVLDASIAGNASDDRDAPDA